MSNGSLAIQILRFLEDDKSLLHLSINTYRDSNESATFPGPQNSYYSFDP